LSCLWELSRGDLQSPIDLRNRYGEDVAKQVYAADAIGVNVLAYATGRRLAGKEKAFVEEKVERTDHLIDRSRLRLAKLRHSGGCEAAPRALIHLLEAAREQLKLRTDVEDQLISITDETLFDYHLVFMHGRNRFQWTDTERRRLRFYLENGGMLFADAICASEAFTAAFRQEMAAIFPDHPIENVPADDPLFTRRFGGADLQKVSRHEPTATAEGTIGTRTVEGPPVLQGIRLGGRWVVLFSPLDVSCALEKHDTIDCRGYTREDAGRIALGVVMYSIEQ